VIEKQLHSGDGVGKAHAAVALWRITGEAKPVIPALTAALDDPALRRPVFESYPVTYYPNPGPAIHRQAVYYFPTPTRQIGTFDDTLFQVVRALGEIGPEAKPAVALLRELAKDADPELGKAAAEAVKKIDPAGDAK
jgi:hypothetical protein